MKSISLKTKIMSGLITGGILLSSVNTAFGATVKPLNTEGKSNLKNECRRIDGKRQRLESNLKKLVTDKTLTQDQANKIRVVIIKDKAVKKANFEKTKTMTEEQRKIYMNNYKINHVSPLKSLVENGTITQAQADKVGLGGHRGSGVHKHNRTN